MIPRAETHSRPEAGVSELMGRLALEAGALVRLEAALAALELAEKARAATRQAWVIGIGLLLMLVGGHALAGALVLWLGTFLPLWLAAVVVGSSLTVTAAIVVALGRARLGRINIAPLKTIQTLKEGGTWAQQLVQ